MRHLSLVKALTRAGIEVKEHKLYRPYGEPSGASGDNQSQYSAVGSGYIARWYVQGVRGKPGTFDAIAVSVGRDGPGYSESYTRRLASVVGALAGK